VTTAEGRYVFGTDNRFEYHIKDHLGNVRATVYDDNGNVGVVSADDYYPFGGTFNSYERTARTPNKYKYNGKELQEETGLYDFGYRMLDQWTGRWNGVDPYADIYESTSPYAYVENNPIIGVDPDGRLVVYVNGFRPGAYGKWLLNQAWSPSYTPPPHEWHYPNWYNDDPFEGYWDGFIDDWSFRTSAREEDFFVDGSNHAMSTADDRFAKGRAEGKVLAEKIKSGEVTLEDGELIKLVGHSMGAAHAMGMAQGLVDARVDPSIIKVFLFAPHQPNQIQGVDGVSVVQVGRDGDTVSSTGIIASATGSEHSTVAGGNTDHVYAPDKPDEAHGGHYIQTFTTAEFKAAAPKLYQHLIDSGIINPDGSLVEN